MPCFGSGFLATMNSSSSYSSASAACQANAPTWIVRTCAVILNAPQGLWNLTGGGRRCALRDVIRVVVVASGGSGAREGREEKEESEETERE